MTKRLLLTESVNSLLKMSTVPATLTIEQCANKLSMSMTSFRRKLTQEETSFKLIQQKYLSELCVHALLTDHITIDSLVIKLGYSERATFERAFRHKFGITAAQFRELSLVGDKSGDEYSLSAIAQHMPPLSDSCQRLLSEKEQSNFNLQGVIDIIATDPIFTGRILGLASKAIYGKTPNTIEEAISRNLGINTVVNLAIIYSVKDALTSHVEQGVINQCIDAFVLAPKLFQLLRKQPSVTTKFDNTLVEQVLIFALLGILLLCHKHNNKHQLMRHSLQGVDDLQLLNYHVKQSMNISVYAASSLMLSLWHIDAKIIKQLNHLDKVSLLVIKSDKQDELMLFMLSCLYHLATARCEHEELEQKAELLGIHDFSEIKALFSER